jgi:hypothetical protein
MMMNLTRRGFLGSIGAMIGVGCLVKPKKNALQMLVEDEGRKNTAKWDNIGPTLNEDSAPLPYYKWSEGWQDKIDEYKRSVRVSPHRIDPSLVEEMYTLRKASEKTAKYNQALAFAGPQ